MTDEIPEANLAAHWEGIANALKRERDEARIALSAAFQRISTIINERDAAIARAEKARAKEVPAGWVLVPVEPDEMSIYAMREAYRASRREPRSGICGQTNDALFKAEYHAEIAAYSAAIEALEKRD